MKTYKEACKELKKVGTSKATGDTLAAMYARTVSFHCRVDGPAGNGPATLGIYAKLAALPDDKAIADKAREYMRDPLSVFECW